MTIEPGIYLNNGESELLVADVRDYKEKKYAYLIDENEEVGYFVEIIREGNGFKFNRVQSEQLTKLLLIEFSDIEKMIKENG